MVGVVIGRFQVDEIHAGHLNLLRTVQEKHVNVLILLGCRKTRANRDNPLNYQMREQMLREICPNAIIMPVFDCQTDELWSRQVDDLIRTAFPGPAAKVRATFDPKLGYPLSVYIDWSEQAADEETGYLVSHFEAL